MLSIRGPIFHTLRGHYMTLQPFFSRLLRPPMRRTTARWSVELLDRDVGPVELTGDYLDGPDRDALVVVHGLGGSTESGYMALALEAAARAGKRCLLLNTRGSDRRGHDVSHAGLVEDIDAALSSRELEGVGAIYLLGYSLGGHLALRYATLRPDPRLRAVAAICSPLSLSRSADAFDAPSFSLYRRHVMASLHEIYTAAYQRNPRGIVPERARRIDKIREWDEHVVAPRFGFASAEHYYQSISVQQRLPELHAPALYVGAPFDPMVPPRAVEIASHLQKLTVHWEPTAGHLGFPRGFDLGLSGPRGLESQVLAWLLRSG